MALFFAFMTKLKANKIFKFISSIKLAVPLMLTVGFTVAYGTIVESRYNAEMAKMMVYQAWWFQILLGLLWINIFTSTLSRIPYKIHHLGFVITHLGLLTLLVGSLVTAEYGIDGQLRVVENSTNDTIILPDLVLELASAESQQVESYSFTKQAHEITGRDLNFLNNKIADRLVVLKYAPFVSIETAFRAQTEGDHGAGLGFILKSQFFNQSEWLHSKEKPDMQLGPAHLRILQHEHFKNESNLKTITKKSRAQEVAPPQKSSAPRELQIEVRKKADNKVLARLSVAKLRKSPAKIGNYKISFKKQYEQAMVSQGGVSEGGAAGKNPAIEIEIEEASQKLREVLYAKFPNFSLHTDGVFGMVFTFSDPNMPTENLSQNSASPHGGDANAGGSSAGSSDTNESSPSGTRGMGNEIEFHVYKDQPEKLRIALFKEGKELLSQWAESGNVIQTPWMGITITIGSLQMNSANETIVTSIEHPLRTNIPPSALQVKIPGTLESQAFWLVEGEAKRFSRGGREFEAYFGRKTLRLPFSIQLEKFYKKDYPGTQTPISYESDVHVDKLPGKIKIAMNEPLQHAGYVLYQASYELNLGQPPASIFSVNQDPGRSIKYAGSLILVLGIIIFTVMRSSKYKQWRKIK